MLQLVKTDIHKRTIWVYAPTLEQRQHWEKIAEQHGVSLSKWILKTVEDSLIKEEDGAVKTRGDIEKENIDIRKEISEMQKNYGVKPLSETIWKRKYGNIVQNHL